MISNEEAVKVAKRHNLSLSDVEVLAKISGSVAEAEEHAATFAGTGQLTDEDLKGMTPHQIVEAKQAGRLNRLLGQETAR